MGNRVPSGNTGDFGIEMFHVSPSIADDESNPSSVYIGEAVHDAGGEYDGRYNVTVAGSYALHVRHKSKSDTRFNTSHKGRPSL